jgi:hypothetical protein
MNRAYAFSIGSLAENLDLDMYFLLGWRNYRCTLCFLFRISQLRLTFFHFVGSK